MQLKYVEIFHKKYGSLLAMQYGDKVIVTWDAAIWQDSIWVDGDNTTTIEALMQDPKATGEVIDAKDADFSTAEDINRLCYQLAEKSLHHD